MREKKTPDEDEEGRKAEDKDRKTDREAVKSER